MSDDEDLPFPDSLSGELERIRQNARMPLGFLEMYLDGAISAEGRETVEKYLSRSKVGREDLEELKRFKESEIVHFRQLADGTAELKGMPKDLQERIAKALRRSSAPATRRVAVFVTCNNTELAQEDLTEIVPGIRYLVRPLTQGKYFVRHGLSQVRFECEEADLAINAVIDFPRAAASEESTEQERGVRTFMSEDGRLTVKIYPGFRRKSAPDITARLEIEIAQ